ncbi:MAG: hypothetical protein V3W14_01880 [Candidatus Neomarinimicrobiota bacterium]
MADVLETGEKSRLVVQKDKDTSMKIGITINQLIRYGYAGLVVVALGASYNWCLVEDIFNSSKTSSFVLVLALFLSGVLLYSLSRPLVMLIYFQVTCRIVRCRASKIGVGSVEQYFQEFQITARPMWLNAFRLIRNTIFPPEVREQLHLQNSEVHVLYMTGIPFLIAGLVSLVFNLYTSMPGIWMVIIGLICLGFAVFVDVDIERQQVVQLRSLDQENVKAAIKNLIDETSGT